MDDDVIRDGREIVDNIVASLNQHHAASSPEHQADWDELLRMQNTPSPRRRQQQQQSPQQSHMDQQRQSAASGSPTSAASTPCSPPHHGGFASGSFQAMGRPSTVRGSSVSSPSGSLPIVGERSSSIFATSPSRRRETASPVIARRTGEDTAVPPAAPRAVSDEIRTQAPASRPRRVQHIPSSEPAILNSSRCRTVQKDSDDTSAPLRGSDRHGFTHTPASLTKLLGANLTVSPNDSRQHSYQHGNANLTRRANLLDGASLPDHLYTQGLLGGRHSDIRVLAFGTEYNLHRLILDRAPFFTLALSEPWRDSKAEEIVLHPDQVDQAITQHAFELALKRLYGCDISEDEDAEAIGLFATGCWLDMQELIDSSVESILRQMEPENLALVIKLVTNNYYGRPGERILSSAKAMLCRDGWDMPLKHWDAIPAQVVQEVVSSDGFYVHNEWDRWNHAKRLYDRRLRQIAIEVGLLHSKKQPRRRAPSSVLHSLPRHNPQAASMQDRLSKLSVGDELEDWYSVYLHSEIDHFTTLMDRGIHYVHMDFEHLQYIKQSKDLFGLPIVPEAVLSEALFQQLQLRQKVLNAQPADLELGLSYQDNHETKAQNTSYDAQQSSQRGLASDSVTQATGTQPSSARITMYRIPSDDCTLVIGGTPDPIMTSDHEPVRHNLSNLFQLWPNPSRSDQSRKLPSAGSDQILKQGQGKPQSSYYSTLPPFRFSAEFPAPRQLKETKRSYSRTVFYAGSFWNIYIQKVRSAKHNSQIGVYLHRAKDREQDDMISTGTGLAPTSVDQRIGLLEREMLMRGGDRTSQARNPFSSNRWQAGHGGSEGDSSTASAADGMRGSTITGTMTGFSSANQDRNAHSRFSDATLQTHILFDTDTDSETEADGAPVDFDLQPHMASDTLASPLPPLNAPFVPQRVATLPPYADSRPTIRTYFKIFSPSKAGRLLSVYESAPDQFDFSQSWGWRSSTLMLDEGLDRQYSDDADDDAAARLNAKHRNSTLRFSVVIGNL